jgi:hypothetical protein
MSAHGEAGHRTASADGLIVESIGVDRWSSDRKSANQCAAADYENRTGRVANALFAHRAKHQSGEATEPA